MTGPILFSGYYEYVTFDDENFYIKKGGFKYLGNEHGKRN